LALLFFENPGLKELEIFAENFDRKAIEVNGLTTSLIDTNCLLLNLFVLKHDELLNGEHLLTVRLNRHQFVIRHRLLNIEEDFKDLMVLVLNLDQTELLLLVFTNEANELAALFNLIKGLDELVGEVLDPIDVLVLDLDEGVADTFLPVVDDRDVLLILDNCLSRLRLDLFKFLQLVLVLLVNVV